MLGRAGSEAAGTWLSGHGLNSRDPQAEAVAYSDLCTNALRSGLPLIIQRYFSGEASPPS